MTAKPQRPTMSILQQAELIDRIVARCTMLGGETAGETHLTLTKDDADDLRALASRLWRMAPAENAIKRLVVGR